MAENVAAAAAWWLLAGNAIVLGCAVLAEFAPRTFAERLRAVSRVLRTSRQNG